MRKYKQLSYTIVLLLSIIMFLSFFIMTSVFTYAFQSDNNNSEILGIIKDGSFIVVETNETKKLTSTGIVQAVTPESGLINVTEYEGKAILVSSEHIDNEWIFGATIIDIADPIETKLVEKIFFLK
jgi:hypothetical protein